MMTLMQDVAEERHYTLGKTNPMDKVDEKLKELNSSSKGCVIIMMMGTSYLLYQRAIAARGIVQ